jgi:hypothetical protein
MSINLLHSLVAAYVITLALFYLKSPLVLSIIYFIILNYTRICAFLIKFIAFMAALRSLKIVFRSVCSRIKGSSWRYKSLNLLYRRRTCIAIYCSSLHGHLGLLISGTFS